MCVERQLEKVLLGKGTGVSREHRVVGEQIGGLAGTVALGPLAEQRVVLHRCLMSACETVQFAVCNVVERLMLMLYRKLFSWVFSSCIFSISLIVFTITRDFFALKQDHFCMRIHLFQAGFQRC